MNVKKSILTSSCLLLSLSSLEHLIIIAMLINANPPKAPTLTSFGQCLGVLFNVFSPTLTKLVNVGKLKTLKSVVM